MQERLSRYSPSVSVADKKSCSQCDTLSVSVAGERREDVRRRAIRRNHRRLREQTLSADRDAAEFRVSFGKVRETLQSQPDTLGKREPLDVSEDTAEGQKEATSDNVLSMSQSQSAADITAAVQYEFFAAQENGMPRWSRMERRWRNWLRRRPFWEYAACAAVVATAVVMYTGITPRYYVLQTASDPPRWALVPVAVNRSNNGLTAVNMPTATPAMPSVPSAPIATPAPDSLAAARHSLTDAERLLASGQLDAALTHYQTGLIQLPTGHSSDALRVAIYDRTGLALASAGRFPEAIQTFRTGVHLFPQASNLENDLGVTLENAGGSENARAALAAFQSALHLDPTSASARDNVASAQHRLGQTAAKAPISTLPPTIAAANFFGS